ncbi:hypothetical protein HPB52_020455 [Rhipicephalus sanguineus]|uniref:Uncharacterized protein n=1 Tax=Rhipicephalus sanguineus TaxID=34632 RepID=A0A9D4T4U6_RHISA|nr:hypothetical protein HPB52_020455 [Rhipicephalus sanguineus]
MRCLVEEVLAQREDCHLVGHHDHQSLKRLGPRTTPSGVLAEQFDWLAGNNVTMTDVAGRHPRNDSRKRENELEWKLWRPAKPRTKAHSECAARDCELTSPL